MVEFLQALWDGGGAFLLGTLIIALGCYLLFSQPNEEEFLPIGHEWLTMAFLKLGGGDPAQAKAIFTVENDQLTDEIIISTCIYIY